MEVAWCSDHGLPHSALLEWDPDDRAKLIAHLLEQASRCQMCGTADWEWEGGRNLHAYEPAEKQCWGCYVKESAAEDMPRKPGARVELIPAKVATARRARAKGV